MTVVVDASTEPQVRVLLVEDEEAHAELVRRAFEFHGKRFRLSVAGSVQEAVEQLASFLPDLVLSDWRLPDGHGTDLLPGEGALVPIIVMTSHGDEQTAVEVMKAGALDYVVKSEDTFSDLPHVAERALREWRLMAERERSQERLAVQYECMGLLARSEGAEEGMAALLERAARHVGAVGAEVWMPEAQGPGLLRRYAWSAFRHGAPTTQYAYAEPDSWVAQLMRAPGQTHGMDPSGAGLDPNIPAEQAARMRACASPIERSEDDVGLLIFFGPEQRWTGDADLCAFIGAVASQLGVFLQRCLLQDELLNRERLATLGTAAAMFAHEVGNPLNSMFLRAQLLSRHVAKGNTEESVSRSVESIVTDIKRLNGLLAEFRSLAQKRPLSLVEVDVGEVITRVVNDNVRGLQPKTLKVKLDVPKGLPRVKGDRDKLVQVFLNLCKNAVEAMPRGGTLSIVAAFQDDNLRVTVADTGPGLPPGVDVFELFKTTKESGTGLGLPVVRQILVAHGGRIDVQNAPGEGATFIVSLPVERSSAA